MESLYVFLFYFNRYKRTVEREKGIMSFDYLIITYLLINRIIFLCIDFSSK